MGLIGTKKNLEIEAKFTISSDVYGIFVLPIVSYTTRILKHLCSPQEFWYCVYLKYISEIQENTHRKSDLSPQLAAQFMCEPQRI